MIDAFPLQWPHHVPRTPAEHRAWGAFKVLPDKATKDLMNEIQRSGGRNPVVSTNRPVRRDGLPMLSAREPDDPGVAVYFDRKGKSICIPCDSYDRVWKNIRAIGLSIRDMRGPEMRGCAHITDQAFTGFAALPAPDSKPWHEVLGVAPDAALDQIDAAWKARARILAGRDDQEQLRELNVARDKARSAQYD